MHYKLLRLEIKNFFRNPQFGVNLFMKILIFLGFSYFGAILIGGAFAVFFIAEKELHVNPIKLVSQFFIYYAAIELVIRYFIQQMPTQNIKPFLTLNITKKILVKHIILKTVFHFLNWGVLLFWIPFGILAVANGFIWWKMIMFTLGLFSISYFNNFVNILLNKKDIVFYTIIGSIIIAGGLEYYQYVQWSTYSEKLFYSFYEIPGLFIIPILLTLILVYIVFKNIKSNFYLDTGLELKKAEGKTENIEFLNQYGVVGTFINNDIRLLKRSKAAKGAFLGSILFLLYGLITYSPGYNNDFMKLFSGIFVTGGFIMVFGQRVPAWDSQHYPLMMTMNVPYKEYLKAKWAFLILTTVISIILALVYAFIGWEFYFTIFAAGLYNIGVNSYLTLLVGVYAKTPIDLNSRKKSFGSNNNFNIKTFLIMLPMIVLPMVIFGVVKLFFGLVPAVIALGGVGVIGFFMKDKIFNFIVKKYKTEKYKTLEAYKKVL